jgi:GR25 family glycosyltransferase involved in LPS biosynthesis
VNIINNFFKDVYVITTSVDTERQKYIIDYLKKNDLSFEIRTAVPSHFLNNYPVKDLWNSPRITNSNEISLCLCYLSILKECIYMQKDKILILEDDIVFEKDYEIKFLNFMENVDNCWNILNFGYHHKKYDGFWKFTEINKYVSDAEVSWTTHMIAFNGLNILSTIAEKIISSTIPIDFIINYFTHICKCEKKKEVMKCYIPNEIICKQLSFREKENKPENLVFKSLIE